MHADQLRFKANLYDSIHLIEKLFINLNEKEKVFPDAKPGVK